MTRKKYSQKGLAKAQRVARFSELHVRHMKDRWAGKPFILEPFQWENMILPTYGQLDRSGKRKIKRALYGIPRWNGKSELTAMLHLYHLYAEPVYGGEQYAFATTRQQAAIIFDTAKRMINADPLLRASTKIYRSVIEVVETGATFRALPFDADTSQGFHPSFASGDEVHVMKNLEMIESMVTGMVGREEGLFVAITTAAAHPGGTLDELRQLWAQDPRAFVYWQGAKETDDPADPKTWRKANPASWITEDMLKSQFQALPLPVFQRLHLNLTPTTGVNARAFNEKAWELCSDQPTIDLEKPCVIGVDAAPRRDKTAVVLDQRDENGIHNVKAWSFEADPEAGLLDFEELKRILRELHRDYNVTRIVVDPAHLFAIMDELSREGLPVEDFPQHANRMIPASMNLYDLIQLGRIKHGGDPLLTKHVLNAGAKEIPPSGWRMTKVSKFDNIDAAVALAMAAHIAESEWSIGGPSFASTGGIYSLDVSL
jgi:phage terminase large subunit-like protein